MSEITNEPLYVKIYKELRNYILSHNLQPGDVLPPEQTLCEEYGVSRNIIREALKGLTLMGVISGKPGIGNVIQPFTTEDIFINALFCSSRGNDRIIFELLDLRKKLELAYMNEAFDSLKSDDIVAIRSILERIKEKWSQNIYFHADDKELHLALFSKIHNEALHDVMECIWNIDENFHVETKMRNMGKTIQKHEDIVLALEEGNKEAFQAAMLAHFSSGKYGQNLLVSND